MERILQMENLITNGTNNERKPALDRLVLIQNDIMVVTEQFAKNSFFTTSGSVKLLFGEGFSKLILDDVPDIVPAFLGKLIGTRIMSTKGMYDSDILYELGYPKPFSPREFTAIVHDFIIKQPNGEEGILPRNGFPNIFYVHVKHPELEKGYVQGVYVRRQIYPGAWVFETSYFPYGKWQIGHCIFSRS